METKQCRICGESFPLSQFHRSRDNKDGLRTECKACSAKLKGRNYTGRVQKDYTAPEGFRRCRVCEEVKPLTEFHRSPSFKDGYRTTCKKCRAEAEGRVYRPPEPEGFKRCRQCEELKPATPEYFSPHSECKGGLHSKCRECVSEQKKVYRETNRERVLERKKAYREANPDKVRAQHQAWVEKNQERVRATGKAYYQRNRQRIREVGRQHYIANQQEYVKRSREWYWANLDKVRERSKTYRSAKPEKVKAILIRYRTRKRNLPDNFHGRDWKLCLEYWNYRCAVCGRTADSEYKLAADHWIPVSYSGEDNPGTVPTNIVPLCCVGLGNCNSFKSNKNPIDWLIEKLGEEAAMQKLAEIETYFEYVSILNKKEQS